MPVKRGERKESNAKRTLLISLLIGNILGAAMFFILLSIASAVILKKGVSSGAYAPISIACAGMAALAAGFISVQPIRKNGLLLGLCSSILLIACVIISAAVANSGVGIKTAITAAVAAVCACVGGILSANMKKKTR